MLINRRTLIQSAAVGAAVLGAPALRAQTTRIRFILDWRFEGPAALFFFAAEKGLFREQGLDVSIDVGSGSAAGVQRMASGAYDMTHADFNTMVELNASINEVGRRPVGFYVTYETSPATIFAMRSSNIRTPKDLEGRKLGAPVFDGARKAFPLFAANNNLDMAKINWTSMDPPLRETMLVRGEVDAISGFFFSGLISLIARGAKEEDIVAMRFADHNTLMYGNTAVTTQAFIDSNPNAVRGFAKALNASIKAVAANPEEGITFVKKREPLINDALELRRLRLVLDNFVMTPTVRRTGLGGVDAARLSKQAADFARAMNIAPVEAARLFNPSFLPPADERRV
jgi:NitT/TauT family transport system substrate-binding protein